MKKYERVKALVSLDAIAHNFEEMHKNVKEGTKIIAVIKADGYGHGARAIARLIQDYDYIWGFATATAEEALELRHAGITKPVLILGLVFEEYYEELAANDVRITISDLNTAVEYAKAGARIGKNVHIHLALDTGMTRIGYADIPENAVKIEEISKIPNLVIEGMFTHFARADEVSTEWTKEPFEKFQIFCHELQKRGVEIPLAHVANSASILRLPSTYLDMVRSGITTYGLFPSDEVKKNVSLRPALSWKTEVVHVKTVHAGTSISYGGTFTAERESVIATIPVGYADGVKRDLSGKGRVLVRGCYAPIVGRICMDQFMIDVTDIPEVKVGDTVTLIGQDGSRRISVEEVAALAHSFNYEYICSITERVPRKYI